MVELNLNIQSDSGRREEAPLLERWIAYYTQAMQRLNRDHTVGNRLQQLMTSAGLVDVQYQRHRLPIGPWLAGTCCNVVLKVCIFVPMLTEC